MDHTTYSRPDHRIGPDYDEPAAPEHTSPRNSVPASLGPSSISSRLRPRLSRLTTTGLKTARRKIARFKDGGTPPLVQEGAGFHLGIAPGIRAAARHAALIISEQYVDWLTGGEQLGNTSFRNSHFTIAVGGGNTVKNQYKALLKYHAHDIDWLAHVRFFFLEETCNVRNRESARDTLVSTFIEPLARHLTATHGARQVARALGLKRDASHADIRQQVVETMTFPIRADKVASELRRGGMESALEEATLEARRYQQLLRKLLGPAMSFHTIIAGIGKDGGIGAFSPHTPELRRKKPGVIPLKRADGGISVALNRGVLTAADRVSLIVSGSLKLSAIGRFEVDDGGSFEQAVMETPLRMLRAKREIAEKVYIFADDRALHFEEGVFRFRENGHKVEIKSEVRPGTEALGVHILLVHGFMGLYSFINLLIRLPAAWTVSALRRGSFAKTLPDDEVFPHYARGLRKNILKNSREGRTTPIVCHSMAGIISDHLLLSVLQDYNDELPEFDRLKASDRKLIEALRSGGIIHIATWAPGDSCHMSGNMAKLKAHNEDGAALDFSGPEQFYELDGQGKLVLKAEYDAGMMSTPAILENLIRLPGIEGVINSANMLARALFKRFDPQTLSKQPAAPYGQRILSKRVLQKVSFYGVLKEINATMHRPREYQARHMKALDAIVKYDIPFLCIVHRDDFLVSANRHVQEHRYLLAARKAREGVRREAHLVVPARLVLLKGDEDASSTELVDSHFLILSHSQKGAVNARRVIGAITSFVDDNLARA